MGLGEWLVTKAARGGRRITAMDQVKRLNDCEVSTV